MTHSHRRRYAAPFPLVLLLAAAIALPAYGCAGGYALERRPTAALGTLAWFAPVVDADRASLARWASAVGPPVFREAARTGTLAAADVSAADSLIVVSWNTALGAGSVDALIHDLRTQYGERPLVLLLQEVYRAGAEVPATLPSVAAFAGRLGRTTERTRDEIEAVADRHSLHAYYVPSMRNGGPDDSDEDRGNAILSTLPLSDPAAIELPFERQRRVAVAATISGADAGGAPWSLRLISAHLDNMMGVRRLWFAGGEYARARQARALVEHLRDQPAAVLGADLNTWFGFADRAYIELARVFPHTAVDDRRATFHGLLRLDHLLFRLPAGWHGQFRRGSHSYGSDHFPLIGTVRRGPAPAIADP